MDGQATQQEGTQLFEEEYAYLRERGPHLVPKAWYAISGRIAIGPFRGIMGFGAARKAALEHPKFKKPFLIAEPAALVER